MSAAGVAQPTSPPELSLSPLPHAVRPSFLFPSAMVLNGLIPSRAHLREGLGAQGAENVQPWPGAAMEGRHTTSAQGQKCSLQLGHQRARDDGVLKKG